MYKISLVCENGASTGMVVRKMKATRRFFLESAIDRIRMAGVSRWCSQK